LKFLRFKPCPFGAQGGGQPFSADKTPGRFSMGERGSGADEVKALGVASGGL